MGEGNGTPLQYCCPENPMDGGAWEAAVHGAAKSQTRLSDFTFTFHFHALEKEMATHFSVLAWRIPGMEKPDGLQSMGSHRVAHNWSDLAAGSSVMATNILLIRANNIANPMSVRWGSTLCPLLEETPRIRMQKMGNTENKNPICSHFLKGNWILYQKMDKKMLDWKKLHMYNTRSKIWL